MDQILYLFHHIHHNGRKHEVHHCGGEHRGLSYTIEHCKCGMHSINKKSAMGHNFADKIVKVQFSESCPNGGWHVESGKIMQ